MSFDSIFTFVLFLLPVYFMLSSLFEFSSFLSGGNKNE